MVDADIITSIRCNACEVKVPKAIYLSAIDLADLLILS